MLKRSIFLHVLAVPLRQKLVAVGIAVGIGSGFWVLARLEVRPPAKTAVLSFTPGASGQTQREPLNVAKDPAISLAQSILSDDVEMGLARQIGPPFTGGKSDVIEFRSRLEMTQPSANSLRVSYKHTDKKLSAAAANAVANLLVAWTPAPVATKLTSAPARESVPFAAPPLSQPNQHQRPVPSPSPALRELEGQLAATEEKLSALNAVPSQAGTSQTADADDASSNTANEQRLILEAQLSAAQKKLDDLRVKFADEFPDVETAKEDMAEIRQKLALLQQASNDANQTVNPQKPAVDKNEIDQLRQNRARLLEAIAVEKRHEAKLLNEAARTADNTSVSQQSASPTLLSQAPARQSVNPTAELILQHPFTLVRLAGDGGSIQSERSLFWYSAFVGIFWGLLYLGAAIRRNLQIGIAAPLEHPMPNKVLNVEKAIPLSGSDVHTTYPWAEEIVKSDSRTVMGREDEALAAFHKPHPEDSQESVADSESLFCGPVYYDDEDMAVVLENAQREPKTWKAHAEEACIALSTGDTRTAITAMKLATTVAPEEVRSKLEMIVMGLDESV